MIQLSLETKEAIVLQALNRGSKSVEEISNLNKVGLSTLQRWMQLHRNGVSLERANSQGSSRTRLSRAMRFEHLLATQHFDETTLGKYCRKHGIYSHELTNWREEFMKPETIKQDAKQKVELKKLKEENKRLERELRRKEKALAEASALLILKKKADLIWGEGADD